MNSLLGLVASIAACTTTVAAYAADDGLITKPSRYSVKETVSRFEAAVKEREAAEKEALKKQREEYKKYQI